MNKNDNWKAKLCREIILKNGGNQNKDQTKYFDEVKEIIQRNICYVFDGEIGEQRKIMYQKIQKCICDFIKKEEIPITEILKFLKNDLRLCLIDVIGFKNLSEWPYPPRDGILQDFTPEMDAKEVYNIFLDPEKEHHYGIWELFSFIENFKEKINPESVDPNEIFNELVNAESMYTIYSWFIPEIFETFAGFKGFNLEKNIGLLQSKFKRESNDFGPDFVEIMSQVKDDKVQDTLRKMNILPPKWQDDIARSSLFNYFMVK